MQTTQPNNAQDKETLIRSSLVLVDACETLLVEVQGHTASKHASKQKLEKEGESRQPTCRKL
jgi:hypothetical protein